VTDAPRSSSVFALVSAQPWPLRAACATAALEAVVLVVQALLVLPALDGQRLAMGLTSALFLAVYGAGLAWCAWCLVRGQSWARAPVVLAQLIQVLVGFTSDWTPDIIGWVLVGVGLAVLVGVFHPRSLAVLSTDEHA
jgi:hypothetical protein